MSDPWTIATPGETQSIPSLDILDTGASHLLVFLVEILVTSPVVILANLLY